MNDPDPRAATISAFTMKEEDGGMRISWSDDPFDFIWQTWDQIDDLTAKLIAHRALRAP